MVSVRRWNGRRWAYDAGRMMPGVLCLVRLGVTFSLDVVFIKGVTDMVRQRPKPPWVIPYRNIRFDVRQLVK